MATPSYPVQVHLDYTEKADRLTSFFRCFVALPILIVFRLVCGPLGDEHWSWAHRYFYAAGGILFLPTLLTLLFRHKYPKWWFDWNVALLKFGTRVFSYCFLLTHVYPSTDEEQAVHIVIPYPDVKKKLSKGMPLVKWFLAIPHVFTLGILYIGVFICTAIAWFAILFTGSYPKSMWEFVVGVLRWTIRVEAYALLLVTDEYPPFSLQ